MTDVSPTAADVWRMFSELQATMTEIKLHLERVDVEHRQNGERLSDHEARLRVIESASPATHAADLTGVSARVAALEKFRYTLAGGIALLAILCSGLAAWVASAIHH